MRQFTRASIEYAWLGNLAAPIEVTIRNGRASNCNLATHGFELISTSSKVQNWHDDGLIKAVHYTELSELAQKFTHCDHAMVSEHMHRGPEFVKKNAKQGPILTAHSDYTESYLEDLKAIQRENRSEASAQICSAKRLVMLQFWRNVGPIQMDYPIAFCDGGTVGRDELTYYDASSYHDDSVNYSAYVLHQPREEGKHHWYTFPAMKSDEVVVFRSYDSDLARNGEQFWTPHAAFRDTRVSGTAAKRHSIEARIMCLFF